MLKCAKVTQRTYQALVSLLTSEKEKEALHEANKNSRVLEGYIVLYSQVRIESLTGGVTGVRCVNSVATSLPDCVLRSWSKGSAN